MTGAVEYFKTKDIDAETPSLHREILSSVWLVQAKPMGTAKCSRLKPLLQNLQTVQTQKNFSVPLCADSVFLC